MSFIPIAEALEVPRQTRQSRDGGTRFPLCIYALVDPLDDCIRYIGVTSRALDERLKLHLEKPTNQRMREWFSDLRQVRQRPQIVKLEWVSYEEWEDAERGWIHWCRARGHLLNVDRGGQARTATGELRPFVAGEYQAPAGASKISQDGLKNHGGVVIGRGPSTKCRPRLVPVAAGVFRRTG